MRNSNEEMPSISHRMSSKKLHILVIFMKELYVSKFFKYCVFLTVFPLVQGFLK